MTCVGVDPTSVNYGKEAKRYWDRLKAPVLVNLTAGYQITEKMGVNLYVNNLFDSVYKDPFKGDYAFTNDRVWSPVGREFALEYVLKFN